MRLLFYDNVNTGHHPGYVAGIVGAAEQLQLAPLVASVDRPVTLSDAGRHIKVEPAPLRSVLANRRQIRAATRLASAAGATVLIDLYLDKQIWAVDAARGMHSTVHVLHHADQYSPAHRTGPARLRTRFLRGRLSRLSASGGVVVVHNERTAAILAGAVDEERIIRAGFPVVPLPSVERRAPTTRPTLLFVGAGRGEKGLSLLFEALSSAPDMAKLRVVGRQPPGLRDMLTQQFPSVDAVWRDEFVDAATLHAEYAGAHLAVLPYRSTFGHHGGPSSVLLETLSAGLPIVTTRALEEQVPAAYGGTLFAESDSASSLGEVLRAAIDDLDDLTTAASAQGPPFVRGNHTYETYLGRLMAAVHLATG